MALNTFTPNTVIESAKVNANFTQFSDHGRHVNLPFYFPGTLQASTLNLVYSVPDNVTWSRCDLIALTAPTGQSIIVDIDRSTDAGATWTTIFTGGGNRPTIAATARTGSTSTVDVSAGTALTHYWRATIDQIGSGTAGADLTVILRGQYDLD